jgi:hypothetical protein
MALELASLEIPPDGSMWVVESPDDPEDLEGREIEVKVPDGTAKRYIVEHAEGDLEYRMPKDVRWDLDRLQQRVDDLEQRFNSHRHCYRIKPRRAGELVGEVGGRSGTSCQPLGERPAVRPARPLARRRRLFHLHERHLRQPDRGLAPAAHPYDVLPRTGARIVASV